MPTRLVDDDGIHELRGADAVDGEGGFWRDVGMACLREAVPGPATAGPPPLAVTASPSAWGP
jgi:hypothetical protein